jgi:hypothetical protein
MLHLPLVESVLRGQDHRFQACKVARRHGLSLHALQAGKAEEMKD